MDDPADKTVEADLAGRFAALRRVLVRVLDEAEAIAARDESFARDLLRLMGTRGPAAPAGEGLGADAPHTTQATPAPVAPPQRVPPEMPGTARPSPASAPRHLVPLPAPASLAPRPVEAEAARYPRQWSAEPFEPARVAQRCRLKAEACRWQAQRSRLLDEGQDVTEGDRDLVARARAADVYLWMVSPAKWRERSDAAFEVVAGCYEALADAAELMALADHLGRSQEPAMTLLAEAQSGVRAAVEDYSSTRRDDDQEAAFVWLRRETDERRVFVEYMQLDHTAPPDNFADLRRRITGVRDELEQLRGRDKSLRDAIRKIRWHAEKLAHLPPGERADPASNDFVRIAQAVEDALRGGLPPSDVALREALLPAIDRMPVDNGNGNGNDDGNDDGGGGGGGGHIPPALARVLDAIGAYLDGRDAEAAGGDFADSTDAGDADEADPLVAEARRRVAGRNAVLIGGQPSEPHRLRLERGLGLASLEWIRVEHHQPFDAAARAIARPGVGLVLILTRWRAHRDGPAARAVCKELGVPLVELPTGYNLRQVAHQLLAQRPTPTAPST